MAEAWVPACAGIAGLFTRYREVISIFHMFIRGERISIGIECYIRRPLVAAPGLVVDQATGETRSGADTRPETGIAGQRADDRTAAGADRCARQGALLARGHVGTASQRHRCHNSRQYQLFHRALRLRDGTAGHGYLPAK